MSKCEAHFLRKETTFFFILKLCGNNIFSQAPNSQWSNHVLLFLFSPKQDLTLETVVSRRYSFKFKTNFWIVCSLHQELSTVKYWRRVLLLIPGKFARYDSSSALESFNIDNFGVWRLNLDVCGRDPDNAQVLQKKNVRQKETCWITWTASLFLCDNVSWRKTDGKL
jgi:hypothetical protein